jgi:hypothetical protein
MTIIVFFGYTVHVVMLFNFSIYILSVNIFWKGWAVKQHFVCYDSTTHYNKVFRVGFWLTNQIQAKSFPNIFFNLIIAENWICSLLIIHMNITKNHIFFSFGLTHKIMLTNWGSKWEESFNNSQIIKRTFFYWSKILKTF